MSVEKLGKAKAQKKDEFYTQLADIERELRHYKEHFKGKTIFCNCDDPENSNFWLYFQLNFYELGLKKLVATHFDYDKPSYKMEIVANPDIEKQSGKPDFIKTPLKQNGDFRSPECIEILKEADIVITNPPFSLFREYIAQLMEYEKKFVIIANHNSIHYKEVFPFIRDNKIWLGYGFPNSVGFFINRFYEDYATSSQHKEGMIRVNGVIWLTNLDIDKRHEELTLYKTYNEEEYTKYLNYDAIEVGKVADIPIDYYGKMGVPDAFLQHYNPEQFDIIGLAESNLGVSIGMSANLTEEQLKAFKAENPAFRRGNPIFRDKTGKLKKPFSRIIIQRKK